MQGSQVWPWLHKQKDTGLGLVSYEDFSEERKVGKLAMHLFVMLFNDVCKVLTLQ